MRLRQRTTTSAPGDRRRHQVRPEDQRYADMAATTVAPVFGTFPASAFAQNVGLVALTGPKGRYTMAAGGGVLAVLHHVLLNEVRAGNRPGASVSAVAESEKDELGDTFDDEPRGGKRPVPGSRP